jgi:glyoxylase-like metal-dependent hydrolase (beta-lactamase superfamily II)
MEIIPNVHHIPLNSANVFLIREEDGLTLIDAAFPFTTSKIVRYIRSIGHDPANLKNILITHADFDHIGGVKALKRLSGTKVYASQPAAKAMAKGISSRELNLGRLITPVVSFLEKTFHLPKVNVDEILSPGQTLPILGGLEVIDTSGHTPGHLSYFAKETGVLFAGDSLHTRTGEIIYNLYPSITWDRDKVIASTRLQAELNPKVVCSGHGPVVFGPELRFPSQ